MIRHWAMLLMLSMTGAQAAMITSIEGELPEAKGWKMTGSLPGEVKLISGRKVLELEDKSKTEATGYTFIMPDSDATRIKAEGFTLKYRVRQKDGDAHSLTLRIWGIGVANIILWRDEKNNKLHVRSWDYDLRKHVGVIAGGLNESVEVVAVWRPGSKVEVSVNGEKSYSMSLSSVEGAPRNSLEIGSPDVTRRGRLIIELLELSSP